jgi:hypothetical protein
MLVRVLYGIGPQPHPTVSPSSGHAQPDPILVGLLLSVLFVPVMFGVFALGCGEFYGWWQRRGWRAKQNRRTLK